MVERDRVHRRLEPRASSVSEARRLVRRSLVDVGEEITDAAELVTSELVTNALVHAGTQIDVSVELCPDRVRVEVADGSPHLPESRRYGATAGTGRGLVMVEELTDEWGAFRQGRGGQGKVVWFEIGAAGRSEAEAAPDDEGPPRHRQRVVDVRLLNIPLILHAVWQQHAAALLREYLLTALDDSHEEEAVQVHASASDALALLSEHLPRPDFGDRPDDLMALARDTDWSTCDATLPVPLGSVGHFAALGRALDDALVIAGRGSFLTPPTQPELQGLRRWICREVERQSRGEPPEAWLAERDIAPILTPPPPWDLSELVVADRAVVAADDTDTIVAASAAAVALLGYDDSSELVGRRLFHVIPARYRQAHLAGFALHLYTGRRPLLDRPMTVPVLRRDGSEVDVELTIRSHALAGERTVFTASLEPAGGPAGPSAGAAQRQ